jgi:amidase
MSLPLDVSENGLPIGVQLVAAHGREDILLRVAAQMEQATPWRTPDPVRAGAPLEASPVGGGFTKAKLPLDRLL